MPTVIERSDMLRSNVWCGGAAMLSVALQFRRFTRMLAPAGFEQIVARQRDHRGTNGKPGYRCLIVGADKWSFYVSIIRGSHDGACRSII